MACSYHRPLRQDKPSGRPHPDPIRRPPQTAVAQADQAPSASQQPSHPLAHPPTHPPPGRPGSRLPGQPARIPTGRRPAVCQDCSFNPTLLPHHHQPVAAGNGRPTPHLQPTRTSRSREERTCPPAHPLALSTQPRPVPTTRPSSRTGSLPQPISSPSHTLYSYPTHHPTTDPQPADVRPNVRRTTAALDSQAPAQAQQRPAMATATPPAGRCNNKGRQRVRWRGLRGAAVSIETALIQGYHPPFQFRSLGSTPTGEIQLHVLSPENAQH